MVPAADVGKRHLHAEIRFDELRELSQAVAEASLGIIGSGRGLVLRWVRGLQHLHRIERLFARAMHHGIDRVVVHGFKRIRYGRSFRIAAAYGEIINVVYRNGWLQASSMRGIDGPRAMARNDDFCAGGRLCRARLSQPSSVDLTPGVPDSMKSCASKCERLGSGEPAACTIASCRWCHSG